MLSEGYAVLEVCAVLVGCKGIMLDDYLLLDLSVVLFLKVDLVC